MYMYPYRSAFWAGIALLIFSVASAPAVELKVNRQALRSRPNGGSGRRFAAWAWNWPPVTASSRWPRV